MLPLLLAACLPHPTPIPVGAVPEDAAVVAIVGEASGREPVGDILAEADVVVLMATGRPSRVLAQWQGAPVADVAILPLVAGPYAEFEAAFPGASAYG